MARLLTLERYQKLLCTTSTLTPEKRGKMFADMAKLLCFCQDAGIKVITSRRLGSCYFVGRRRIRINTHKTPARMIAALLHELGHARVENWRRYRDNTGLHGVRTKHTMLNYLEEEFEAWNQGWIIAKRLDLCISERSFVRCREYYLYRYVQWANKKGKKLPTHVMVGS